MLSEKKPQEDKYCWVSLKDRIKKKKKKTENNKKKAHPEHGIVITGMGWGEWKALRCRIRDGWKNSLVTWHSG